MSIPSKGKYLSKLAGRIVVYEPEKDGTKTGSLCLAIPCSFVEGEHAGFTCRATVTLMKSDGTVMTNAVNNMRSIFGTPMTAPWTELPESDFPDARFEIDGEPATSDKGTEYFKANWCNPVGGGMSLPTPIDPKAAALKYGAKFRALAGGASLKTTKKTPPAAPAALVAPAGPVSTLEEAWAAFQSSKKWESEKECNDAWFHLLKTQFNTNDNSKVTGQQWHTVKEQFADAVPM